jgi:hypothetical protein
VGDEISYPICGKPLGPNPMSDDDAPCNFEPGHEGGCGSDGALDIERRDVEIRTLRTEVARLTAEREEDVAHLTREYEANREEWLTAVAAAERAASYAVQQAGAAQAEAATLRALLDAVEAEARHIQGLLGVTFAQIRGGRFPRDNADKTEVATLRALLARVVDQPIAIGDAEEIRAALKGVTP